MKNVMERERKRCEEMQLAGMIWWLILWYASDEGRNEIPSEQQWLSCELVATIVEEVTGEKFEYSWRHGAFGQERHHNWDEWPRELNAQMDQCGETYRHWFNGDINGVVRGLLKQFVRYNFQAVQNEKDWLSELRTFHESNTPRPIGRSRFTPCFEMYSQAVGELLRYTSAHHADVCEWCRKIGAIMRPYIERDVAYIKRHYTK